MPELVLVAIAFDGTDTAANVLNDFRLTKPDFVWVEEVAIIERHRSGRVSSRGTYSGYYFEDEEGGDTMAGTGWGALTGSIIGIIGGPAGVAIGAATGGVIGGSIGAIGDLDKRDAVYKDIKSILPKGSSALLLLAAGPTTDEMVAAFEKWNGEVHRRDVSEEEVGRLQSEATKG